LGANISIAGSVDAAAVRGAAGTELIMEAGYILDHLADGEIDPALASSEGEELALGLAMLCCGFAAISEVSLQKHTQEHCFLAIKSLFRSAINAACGQHLDALFEKRQRTSMAEALEMTFLKAGSLGRLAAEVGAGLATTDTILIEVLGDFGSSLFTYAQLMDDLKDALPQEGIHGDFLRGKKTIPLVFLTDSTDPLLNSLEEQPVSSRIVRHRQEVGTTLHTSGAYAFCAILAETFLNRAKLNLGGLESYGVEASELAKLLESLADSSMDVLASV
jgi:geranylgeranyl pyrophosphate synthase